MTTLLLVVCALALTVPFPCSAKGPVRITLLHVNDFHGRLAPFRDKTIDLQTDVGGAANLAGRIHEERRKNPHGTLLLSAGDMFQGTPVSNLFHGQPVLEIMNHLGFDAMVLGNHEFDWGVDALGRIISEANFPVLSTNVFLKTGQEFPGVRPYVVVHRAGIRVGVLGVTTPDTPYAVKPSHVAGLEFRDPVASLKPWVEELRSRKVQLIVVLSHLGLEADRELARQIPGLHVIVGGHSHTVLHEPILERDTLIVQAGYYGIYLGVLHLEVDPETGNIVRPPIGDVLSLVSSSQSAAPDVRVQEITDTYRERIQAKLDGILGETRVDLMRNSQRESNLGNLICDAIREATGAPLAFHNSGGIRSDILAGPIKLEQLYTVLPFDNQIVTMDLTGDQILQILEESGNLERGILQVSGLEVVLDLSRPQGSRVSNVRVGSEKLDPLRTYRVATNDFLAAGGDHFETFRKGTQHRMEEDLRVAVQAYIERHSPLAPAVEGRIRFLAVPGGSE